MFIDARALPEDTLVETEICIIGAGAAGITLAREFINQSYQVCLLESGGLDFDRETQSLYTGENIGESYYPLGEARARYHGGSTNVWGGWSRPLDEIDFEDRPWMPYSGWPFTKAELDPYYARAQRACQLGPFEYDFAYWKNALGKCQQLSDFGDQVATYVWQVIPPTHVRFGEAYRAEIEQARNIKTYLHANVVDIETDDTAQRVTRLHVASLDGKKFWVAAKVFILAAGGIENSRLLLVSNKTQTHGLGNQHDLVGRFFMEHPIVKSDKILLSRADVYTRGSFQVGETFISTGLAPSKAVQEREQILNFSIKLGKVTEEWMLALNRLRYKMEKTRKPTDFPTLIEGHKYRNETLIQDLGKLIANLDRVAAKAYAKLFKKSLSGKSSFYRASLIAEQAPNPDSRITLSPERDRLGLNRVQLDWRLSPIDRYTILRSQQIIAEEFNRSGLGQFPLWRSEDDISWQSLKGSYHHIGTTRMSDNPKQGVVNEHCQVHGINNLYIAGSSVFPTSGLSNPTLTIVALAIRLADHVKDCLRHSTAVTQELEATATH